MPKFVVSLARDVREIEVATGEIEAGSMAEARERALWPSFLDTLEWDTHSSRTNVTIDGIAKKGEDDASASASG